MSYQHEKTEFYMVWTKGGHAPRKSHDTFERAEKEAIRLAQASPGRKYIVLQAVGKYHVPAQETSAEAFSL